MIGSMGLEITDQHRREMTDQGYTIFQDVFTVGEMDNLSELVEEFEKRMNLELTAVGGVSGISRANEITFNDHLAERDERVKEFALRSEFVALSSAFLGPDTDLYWNQTVFKHPEGDRIFPWHQDDAYTPVTPSPYLTLWLALNDATEENGCISVLPGSHKKGLIPHNQSDIGLVGYSSEAEDQGTKAPITAGSLIAFWSLTLHKSGPNRSKGIRKAYVLQYSAKGLRRVAGDEAVEGLLPVARGGESA